MPEIKFSCPQCGQHIQCSEGYFGRKINCPNCQDSINVPGTPVSAAPPPPPPPPAPAPSPVKAAMHIAVSAEPPHAPPPAPEPLPMHKVQVGSPVAKKVLIAALAIIAIGAAGVFGYNYYQTQKGGGDSSKPKNTAAATPVATNTAPPELTAEEISQKADDLFLSLNTYSAKVKSVGTLDMSGLASTPGMESKMAAMLGNQTNEIEFTVKLGKTNYYLIECKGRFMSMPVQGGIWNCGAGDFILSGNKTYMKMPNRQTGQVMLLSMSGITAVGGMVGGFFEKDASQSKALTKESDETINGEECYVLSGVESGIKIREWVSKSSFLVLQTQMVLGSTDSAAPPTEGATPPAQNNRKRRNQRAETQQPAQPAAPQDPAAIMAAMKGTIIDTWTDIQTNQPMGTNEYKMAVPAGAKLTKMPTQAQPRQF